MTKKYVKFSKPQYEYNLAKWKRNKIIYDYLDVQPDLVRNGYTVNEVVYMVKTHRKDVNILVYTSLDTRDSRVREKGSDAVRVVLVWRNKEGKRYYRKVKKHLRINTMFDNLEKTLHETIKFVGSPSFNFSNFREGIGLLEPS